MDQISNSPESQSDELVVYLYHEIRVIARQQLARERSNHTLGATALVNELYMKLAGKTHHFDGRQEFLSAVSRIMRNILVDYGRARNSLKRGSGRSLPLEALQFDVPDRKLIDLEDLDEALRALAKVGQRQAQVVEMRFFAGFSVDETAFHLGVSPKTVKRDWVMARSWLRAYLDTKRDRGTVK